MGSSLVVTSAAFARCGFTAGLAGSTGAGLGLRPLVLGTDFPVGSVSHGLVARCLAVKSSARAALCSTAIRSERCDAINYNIYGWLAVAWLDNN